MEKKSKDEAAAIRDKAIERFLKLRSKIEGIRNNSVAAGEDRESASHLLEKYKAELTFLDSPVFPGMRNEESQMWAEKRELEREEVVVKINRYQAIKDDADRRYCESCNKWQEFGNLISASRKAIVELGFMSQEEVR